MNKYAGVIAEIRNHVKKAQAMQMMTRAQREAASRFSALKNYNLGQNITRAAKAGVPLNNYTRIKQNAGAAGVMSASKNLSTPGQPRQQQLQYFQSELQRLPQAQQQMIQKNPTMLQNLWQSFTNVGQLPVGG